jgi:hypothetical protein
LFSAQIQYAALDAATPVHILDYFTGIDFPAKPAGLSLPRHTLLQNVSTVCWYERFPHLGLSDVGILLLVCVLPWRLTYALPPIFGVQKLYRMVVFSLKFIIFSASGAVVPILPTGGVSVIDDAVSAASDVSGGEVCGSAAAAAHTAPAATTRGSNVSVGKELLGVRVVTQSWAHSHSEPPDYIPPPPTAVVSLVHHRICGV